MSTLCVRKPFIRSFNNNLQQLNNCGGVGGGVAEDDVGIGRFGGGGWWAVGLKREVDGWEGVISYPLIP